MVQTNLNNYYNRISKGYDELHGTEQKNKLKKIFEALGQDLLLNPADTLLDVGCGTGISTEPWNCKCVGIDTSKALIKIAKQKFKNNKTKTFIEANAENLPFPDEFFDVVISITALHNFKDLNRGLEEIKRVGKKFFILTALRKAKEIEEIQKKIIIKFKIKKIVIEDKDLIFICEKR